MTPRLGRGWLALIAAVIVLAGCAGDKADEGIAVQDPDLVAAGAELYAANCARCHGADLGGTDSGPPFLSEIYAPSHHPDQVFPLAVQLGVRAHHWRFGDMPPVEELTPEDVEAIVAFVRDQQRIHGLAPYP